MLDSFNFVEPITFDEKARKLVSSAGAEQSAQHPFNESDEHTGKAEKAVSISSSAGARKPPRTTSEIPGQIKVSAKAKSTIPGAERVKPARRNSKAFQQIADGLKDALEYAREDKRMTERSDADEKSKYVDSVAGAETPPHQSASDGGACLEERNSYDEKFNHPVSSDVQLIVALQRRRRFILKSQMRIDRSTESFLASAAGFRIEMEPKQRLALFKQVSTVRKAVEKEAAHFCGDEKSNGDIVASLPHWADRSVILSAAASREVWDKMRADTEKQMEAAAKRLPVWPFVKTVKGFGAPSLAAIVGEAGDLSAYPSKSHLWKRLGLAVIEGERQKKCANAEKAIAHGYNPSRRSVVYVIAEALSKHQMSGDKDEAGENPKVSGKAVAVPAHPTGPYGEAYYYRKAITAQREGWTAAHQHADALRYMSKKLLSHLRSAWIAAEHAAR